MIDLKFLRENPEIVKENIKNKFQDQKLHLVDEVIELDKKNKEATMKGDELRQKRNLLSSTIGSLIKDNKTDEVGKIKTEVSNINDELAEIEKNESEFSEEIKNLTLFGFKYNIDNITLKKGDSLCMSNIIESNFAKITLEKGKILCVIKTLI